MALTANRYSKNIVGDEIEIPVKAGQHIYAGGMVCVAPANGYAYAATTTASRIFMGVAVEEADNTLGNDGDITVKVKRKGVFLFDASSITQAMVGTLMYVVDDCTFDDSTGAGTVECGILVKFVSVTSGWIDIGRQSTP
jgi:hypothetical protein